MDGIGPSGGVIELKKGHNFEQALEDLSGFSHIWILGHFNRVRNWKPKIQPPRGERKVGCLASRSPHRPNPISMSVVPLFAVEGLKIWVGHHDLMDGTPVLDIKPYIDSYDALQGTQAGWTESVESSKFDLEFSSLAKEQILWLEEADVPIKSWMLTTLSLRAKPSPNNRIKAVPDHGEDAFRLSVKTWRVNFERKGSLVKILSLESGYKKEVLDGKEDSPWQDVELHNRFIQKFTNP